MIPKAEWIKGVSEWKNARYHAEVTIALADLLQPALEAKIKEIEEQEAKELENKEE